MYLVQALSGSDFRGCNLDWLTKQSRLGAPKEWSGSYRQQPGKVISASGAYLATAWKNIICSSIISAVVWESQTIAFWQIWQILERFTSLISLFCKKNWPNRRRKKDSKWTQMSSKLSPAKTKWWKERAMPSSQLVEIILVVEVKRNQENGGAYIKSVDQK